MKKGGLKYWMLLSIFKALIVEWVQRYTGTGSDSSQAAWKTLLRSFSTPYGDVLVFYCNINSSQVKEWKNVPMFYKDMLNFYYELIQPDKVCLAQSTSTHKPFFYHIFVPLIVL